MDRLVDLLRQLVGVLGNDGAVANAAALGRQRRHEAWRVAALERATAPKSAPPRRREPIAS